MSVEAAHQNNPRHAQPQASNHRQPSEGVDFARCFFLPARPAQNYHKRLSPDAVEQDYRGAKYVRY